LQNPPIEAGSVDLVILSQALHHAEDPAGGIGQRGEIIKTARTDLLLDLLKHNFDKARETFTATAGPVSPKAICTTGWKRLDSRRLRSASSPPKNNRHTSRPFWRSVKNN